MKVFNLSIKIDPLAEFDLKTKAQIKSRPKLLRHFLRTTFEETAELDERKWDIQKLTEAALAVIRYEQQLLEVQVADILKSSKGDDQDDALEKAVSKFKSDSQKKLSLALEELKSNAGPSKKAVKDLSGALKKLNANVSGPMIYNTIAVYEKIIIAIEKANKNLSDPVSEDEGDGKGNPVKKKSATKLQADREAALKSQLAAEARAFETAASDFSNKAKQAEQAAEEAKKIAKAISKDQKDVEAAIVDLAQKLNKKEQQIDAFVAGCKKLEKEAASIRTFLTSEDTKKELPKIVSNLSALKASGDIGKTLETWTNKTIGNLRMEKAKLKL